MTTIPKTMHAIICHAPDDYRLQEYPAPTPSSGEILLRTHSVGICASDLKCYLGAPPFWGDAHRIGNCQAPVITCHEFFGEVVALGKGANEKYGLALGDQVVSEQIVPCQQCRYCRRGQYWMCQVHDIHGAHLSPHCYPIAIDLLAKGLLPMDQILTHSLPLKNFQEGIDLIAAGDPSIKVSLAP